MKTRAFRNSFFLAVGVAVFAALSVALPQVAQAQAADIAVLHNKMANADSTLKRIGEQLDRMDEKFTQRIARLEETVIRLEERIGALQMRDQFIVIPLLLLILATMFGLLTKGHYWGVDRQPKASGARRGGSVAQPQPVAGPA